MQQLELFANGKISKTIEYLPLDCLEISEFNYRKTRNGDDLNRLAQRIERNGFEVTRALWVHRKNGHYAIFAGGNRFEAAKIAGLDTVPVVVHNGLTDAEIAKLALEDNENDEYHTPVDMVDVWDYYAALYERLGTEQAVADLLGVSRQIVNFRIRLANLPQWIKTFATKQSWNEGNLREFLRVLQSSKVTTWLTHEDALRHVANKAANKSNPTAKVFAAIVDELNEVIQHVSNTAEKFGRVTFYHYGTTPKPYEWDALAAYFGALKAREVRTIDEAIRAEHEVNRTIAEEAQRYNEYTKKRLEDSQVIEVKTGDWWRLGTHMLYCGDTSSPEFSEKVNGAKFAFADPPYNADAAEWDTGFEWAHDYLADAAEIVAVTPGISAIFDFARKTAMQYKWSMSCWIDNGMTRGAVGFGNWIYIALFSSGSVYRNSQDMIRVSIDLASNNGVQHKGKKPIELIKELLRLFTEQNDIVIDPFLGSGTTMFACEQMSRTCIGGEIQPSYCKQIIETWQKETGKKAEKL